MHDLRRQPGARPPVIHVVGVEEGQKHREPRPGLSILSFTLSTDVSPAQ